MDAPQFPAGPWTPESRLSAERRGELIAEIESLPGRLNQLVAELAESALETRYRNWTIRQIVHHVADSHVNCYIRFKWALTEEHPTIKAYNEGAWAELDDSRTGDVGLSLALLAALHARWVLLLRTMTDEQFARSFLHPESGADVALDSALSSYAWHGRHHTAQIAWLVERLESRPHGGKAHVP